MHTAAVVDIRPRLCGGQCV